MPRKKQNVVVIPGLVRGLNVGSPRDQIALQESTAVENFTVVDGSCQKRYGYSDLGGTNTPIRASHFHHYQDGNSGEKRMWVFSDGSGTPDIAHKESISEDFTAVTPTITPTNGKDYYWSSTEIIDFSEYTNYLIAVQADTRMVRNLTGAPSCQVLMASKPSKTSMTALTGGAGYHEDSGHYCKRAINYHDHLFLLHTYEKHSSWYDLFQRIRYSNLAEFQDDIDWTDGGSGSTAGYIDIKSDYGAILNGEKLRSSLIVYSEQAITSISATNKNSQPFVAWESVSGIGLFAPRLLANLGDEHVFMANNGQIYRYSGGRDLTAIGDKVRREIFESLNTSTVNGFDVRLRSWAGYMEEKDAVIFAFPTGTGDVDPNSYYIWHRRYDRWEKVDYNDVMLGLGSWERPSGLSYPMPVYGSTTKIFKTDDTVYTDDGNAVASTIETKDFVIDLQDDHELFDIYFEASGDGASASVTVSISVDSGTTWTDYGAVTVGTGWGLHQLNVNITGYVMRLKFASSSTKLKLGSIRFDISPNAEDHF